MDLSDLSDTDAIRLVQQGEAAAFKHLYQLHSRRVLALRLRVAGNTSEAEDMTQDAFIQWFLKIQGFHGESSFSMYPHRLTFNIVFMRFPKREPGEILLIETCEPVEESGVLEREFGGPDHHPSELIGRGTLQVAIDQLPAAYKKVFILQDVEGYGRIEITGILGCSIGNSKPQLYKARIATSQAFVRTGTQ